MAKEIALSKRAKISEAQQYVLLSVLGASIFLGAAIALIIHFVKVISFNANVIAEEEKAIVAYSDTIKNIGICVKPAGTIYSDAELQKCNPDAIDVSSLPGTLRANILVNIASNQALNSVPKESSSACTNPLNGKNYTYAEMLKFYNSAATSAERIAASRLIRSCSALRVVPDALPSLKNEEALLASLNKIFILSNIEPNSLSPTGSSTISSLGNGIEAISIRLSPESDSVATITKFLDNVERSIREFNIERATITWADGDKLSLQAQASAYYMTPSTLKETTQVIKGDKDEK